MMLMNPEIRDALTQTFLKLGEESGKLSVPQFIAILKQFVGFNPNSVAAQNTGSGSGGQGLAFILLCRFVDRDGDGYISADDIFTSQALVSQRSDLFLKAVFRIYSEAIWYPGRQLNFMNLLNKSTKKPPVSSSTNSGKVLDDSFHVDVVEPPKYITGSLTTIYIV